MYIHSILLFFIVVVLSVSPVNAATAVTLYPSGAVVRADVSLTQQGGKVELPLPAGADPESINLIIPGVQVQGLTLVPGPRADSPRTAEVRKNLEAARAALQALDDQLAALNARLELWKKPPVQLDDVAALNAFDARVTEQLSALLGEKANFGRQRRLAEQDFRKAEDEWNRVTGLPADAEPLQSTVILVSVAAEPGKMLPEQLPAVLEYSHPDCGWTPEYRLEGLTGKGVVRVSRQGVLRQRTGADWKDVQVRLATADAASHVSPVPVQPWVIRPGNNAGPGPMPRNVMMAPALSAKMETSDAAPLYGEEQVSMMWDLGTVDLASGDTVQITMDTQEWPATFYRLVRPLKGATSWLMAEVRPTDTQYLPTARARLFVDGLATGSTVYTFSPDSLHMALGVDPAVTAVMELDSNQSGDRGLIAKSQTRVWAWTIKVRNAHASSVDVRVEDAVPQSGDERVQVKVESSPAAVQHGQTLQWKLAVPGNGVASIAHKVSLSAPADLPLRPGR